MAAEKERSAGNLREQSVDVEQFGEIAHERHEAMQNMLERAERKQRPRHSEREVVAEAQRLAKEVEEANKDSRPVKSRERRQGPITKKQLDASFKSQMKDAENELSPLERATSRLIHAKPIEKTLNAVASSVARPNAMLSGSIAAFIGITVLYFISKYYGFQLSGFETLGAFIVGWIVGVLYDYFSLMIRGHR